MATSGTRTMAPPTGILPRVIDNSWGHDLHSSASHRELVAVGPERKPLGKIINITPAGYSPLPIGITVEDGHYYTADEIALAGEDSKAVYVRMKEPRELKRQED